LGLVKVADTREPGTVSAGGDPDTLVHSDDGATLEWYAIPEYATYQTFTATVLGLDNEAPTVGAVAGCPQVIATHPFDFGVTANDANNDPLTYQWDNGFNTPGVYDDGTTSVGTISFTYPTPGNYTVGVQVSDGVAPPVVSPDPLEIAVLPDGVFVDADNTGTQNGSWTNPWTTIIAGITNSTPGSYIYVEPAAANYVPPALQSGRTVLGFDRSCMGQRPTINITTPVTLANGINTIALENLIFNYAVNSGGTPDLVRLQNTSGVSFKNCKFTGFSAIAPPPDNASRYVSLSNVDNVTVQGCEFVNIEHRLPANAHRSAQIWTVSDGSDNVAFQQNEWHHIGWPNIGPDNYWSVQNLVSFQYGNTGPGPLNPTFRNNLVYDIYDNTPSVSGNQNYITTVFFGNSTNFTLANNTWDDVDPLNGNSATPGVAQAMYGAAFSGTTTIKNNIYRGGTYYVGSPIYSWNAGFWMDGPGVTTPATYSCVYWGNPAPPPFPTAQVDDYLNLCTAGVGCITQEMLIDPNFDLAPGPNFYRPQASQVLTGGEGGTQMGAFGGPLGNWTPPSQQ
ncbi:MAG TPA: PKD domain-containing protein, partial [bacterium]|nr:PKD domain-containing protein [bacterium]